MSHLPVTTEQTNRLANLVKVGAKESFDRRVCPAEEDAVEEIQVFLLHAVEDLFEDLTCAVLHLLGDHACVQESFHRI